MRASGKPRTCQVSVTVPRHPLRFSPLLWSSVKSPNPLLLPVSKFEQVQESKPCACSEAPLSSISREMDHIRPERLADVSPVSLTSAHTPACDCGRFTVCTVLDLQPGHDCFVIGTLYKHMRLKPSILDEYVTEVSVPTGVRVTCTAVREQEKWRHTSFVIWNIMKCGWYVFKSCSVS